MKHERRLGSILAVSVGTAIAIETLIGPNNTAKVSKVYINLRTVFRNYHEAFDSPYSVPFKKYCADFIEELNTIEELINVSLNGSVNVVWYLGTYVSVAKEMPLAKIWVPSTDKQKAMANMEYKVLFEQLPKNSFFKNVIVIDSALNGHNSNALILTHMVVDLLSHPRFKKLSLLESHTGKIKEMSEWNTKLGCYKNDPNIPFNVLTIQLFGDKSTTFNSLSRKVTEPIYQLAKDKRWHPGLGLMRVKYDLDVMSEKELSSKIYKPMTNVRLK